MLLTCTMNKPTNWARLTGNLLMLASSHHQCNGAAPSCVGTLDGYESPKAHEGNLTSTQHPGYLLCSSCWVYNQSCVFWWNCQSVLGNLETPGHCHPRYTQSMAVPSTCTGIPVCLCHCHHHYDDWLHQENMNNKRWTPTTTTKLWVKPRMSTDGVVTPRN